MKQNPTDKTNPSSCFELEWKIENKMAEAGVKKQKIEQFAKEHRKIDSLSSRQLATLCHDLFSRLAEMNEESALTALTTQ